MSYPVETVMEIHPLANMIPPMSADEFADLKADIELNGQQVPIQFYEDKILDGRHRYRACLELGLHPKTSMYEGDDPVAHVISLNLRRRNLTTGQLATAALALLDYEKERARERQRAGGAEKVRQNSSEPSDARRSTAEAGAKVGVSRHSVERAAKLQQERPDLLEKVKTGETTLNAAVEEHKGKNRPTNGGTKQKPVYGNDTERGRQVNRKASERLWKLMSGLDGYRMGLRDFDVSRAIAGATDEEIKQWERTITDSIKAFRDLRSQLREDN